MDTGEYKRLETTVQELEGSISELRGVYQKEKGRYNDTPQTKKGKEKRRVFFDNYTGLGYAIYQVQQGIDRIYEIIENKPD